MDGSRTREKHEINGETWEKWSVKHFGNINSLNVQVSRLPGAGETPTPQQRQNRSPPFND
jgi:hypothetical protein